MEVLHLCTIIVVYKTNVSLCKDKTDFSTVYDLQIIEIYTSSMHANCFVRSRHAYERETNTKDVTLKN